MNKNEFFRVPITFKVARAQERELEQFRAKFPLVDQSKIMRNALSFYLECATRGGVDELLMPKGIRVTERTQAS